MREPSRSQDIRCGAHLKVPGSGGKGAGCRVVRRMACALTATGGCRVPDSPVMSPLRVRPVGGAAGCLVMLLVSVVLSVLLTVGINLLIR